MFRAASGRRLGGAHRGGGLRGGRPAVDRAGAAARTRGRSRRRWPGEAAGQLVRARGHSRRPPLPHQGERRPGHAIEALVKAAARARVRVRGGDRPQRGRATMAGGLTARGAGARTCKPDPRGAALGYPRSCTVLAGSECDIPSGPRGKRTGAASGAAVRPSSRSGCAISARAVRWTSRMSVTRRSTGWSTADWSATSPISIASPRAR